MCCSEQILEAASYKIAAVQALPPHLRNHSVKMNKVCWGIVGESKEKLITVIFLRTPTHGHTGVGGVSLWCNG